jgi:hypothetical protein
MGGDGGYGGNGSIYWRVRHKGGGGAPQKLKNKAASANPNADHWIDIGAPATAFAETSDEIEGHDPIDIGPKGTVKKNFQVDLRFSADSGQSVADLINKLLKVIDDAGEAIGDLVAGETDVSLSIEVPAIPRTAPPTGQGNDKYEVAVEWK